jgi:phenylacetate-CoA ligase
MLDFVLKNPVRADLKQIENLMAGRGATTSALQDLISNAVETTRFYSKIAGKDINKFPVINKNIIRENFEDFVSDRFPRKSLIPVVTSGSTGTPFKVYHDRRKKVRNNADTIYFARLAGFEVGDRLVYLKIWAKEKMAGPLRYWLQNVIPVDVIHLNDDQIGALIERMENEKSTYGILGYVSALELVCRYLDRVHRMKVNAKVNSIITMSESLSDYVKCKMEEYFGVPVYSRYSNLENGILAQQVPGSEHRFLVNTASYYVEIFKLYEDVPVGDREVGRIVVTDLYNFAMPLIRYDTGDLGSLVPTGRVGGNLYLETVEGRKLDVLYDTRGQIVSSYIMYKNMWKYTEIKQYQLIQKDKQRYVLKVNADQAFSRHDQVVSEFKSYLGEDADFKIEMVDEIPLLDSGKRRKLVNEMIAKA